MSYNESTRLRLLEAIALISTLGAIGLTALLEPATAAVESNPVARTLLTTLGWTGAGISAVLLEVALFGAWRRLHRRGYARSALFAGSGIAAVGLLDLGANIIVLLRVGFPETARLSHYAGALAPAAALTLLALVRPGPRSLLSAGREVTSRLSAPELSGARSVLLVGIVVLSVVSGAVTFGPLPAADKVDAAETVIKDFESGSSSADGVNVQSDIVFEGNYAAEVKAPADSYNNANLNFSKIQPDSFSFAFRYDRASDSYNFQTPLFDFDDYNYVVNIRYESANGVREATMNNGSSWVKTGLTYETGTWYENRIVFNRTDGTVKLQQLDSSNNLIDESQWIKGLYDDPNGDFDSLQAKTYANNAPKSSSIHIDSLAKNTDKPLTGQPVSGRVTSEDGDRLDGATVQLLDSSDNVISTTTSNDTGYYDFGAVSDGSDYQIRASANGYQNNTSGSFDVAGAPKTVDLTLPDEDTYKQTFQLDDNTGAFPDDETSLIVEKYDGTTGNWSTVSSQALNDRSRATFRLTKGAVYRVTARNVIPNRRTAVESWSGITASEGLPDPYVLQTAPLPTDATSDATPTPTTTGTPGSITATDDGTSTYPWNEDEDGDGLPNWFDPDHNGDGVPNVEDPEYPDASAVGPLYLSECQLDGEAAARITYFDPAYNTSTLDYEIRGPDGAVYNGTKDFQEPVGRWTECVAGTLTGNITEEPDDEISLIGNATAENGTQVTYESEGRTNTSNGLFGGGGGGGAIVSDDAGSGAPLWTFGIPAAAAIGYAIIRRRRGGDGASGGGDGASGGGGGPGGGFF